MEFFGWYIDSELWQWNEKDMQKAHIDVIVQHVRPAACPGRALAEHEDIHGPAMESRQPLRGVRVEMEAIRQQRWAKHIST
eukprot:5626591-Amphidinium_carterae.1